jgi:hypothetical protein
LRHNAKSDRSTAAAVTRNLDSLGRLAQHYRRSASRVDVQCLR